jgi:hypothetical protein
MLVRHAVQLPVVHSQARARALNLSSHCSLEQCLRLRRSFNFSPGCHALPQRLGKPFQFFLTRNGRVWFMVNSLDRSSERKDKASAFLIS